MSDKTKNSLSIATITSSDTISEFMEKCNNNFSTIFSMGGGPAGVQGEQGVQGVPTKPKVPIHAWREGPDFEYYGEPSDGNGGYIISNIYENLEDEKYQLGHLIMLQNGHVYILAPKNENSFDLTPKFIMALQSYHPNHVIDGRSSYVHIAYANDDKGDGMITDQEYRNENNGVEVATFNVRRTASSNTLDISNKSYMGIYSDFEETSSDEAYRYTWIRIRGDRGEQGIQGIQGEQGTQGEAGQNGQDFTGQQFIVDIDGDMSTISLDIDRTRLYDSSDDYCKCTLHAYYGKERTRINVGNITINSTDEYIIDGNGDIVLKSNRNAHIGKIEKEQSGNDVAIKFTPDENFIFPQKSILFPIHISTVINDNGKTYEFNRDIVWTVKGIVSPFELEILPQYRTIKLSEEGYFPQILFVDVYKDMDGNRTLFNFNDSENQNFKLLYKFYDSNDWIEYTNNGVPTNVSSCIEFKVIRYIDSGDSNSYEEEVWDYEDVWVVSDGKDSHYYHADLGNTESMMVLTTGVKKSIDTTEYGTIYYAELKNESYSITFNPTFYDGTEPLVVKSVSIDSNNDNEYYINQTFVRELTGNTLTITRVPWGVDMIPMSIDVETTDGKKDHVPFSVYISSTVSDIYTLIPTVSVYNTSTGKDGEDKIGCDVYKNNSLIPNNELNLNALELKYVVYNNKNESNPITPYTEPLVYGQDDDAIKDNFTASDVAIEFILYHRGEEIVRSTVPLIKDGIDGRDGDTWQYIFCRSSIYPFSSTGISNPKNWENDPKPKDNDNEYLGDKETGFDSNSDKNWYDDHKGVDSTYKYEYQSYRKWNKDDKKWGKYGEPTLYSNYSEGGSGYNVILSNPISVIPVGDDDWSVNENLGNQNDHTYIYLYNSTTDITSEKDDKGNNKVSISLPENNIYVENGNFTVDNNTHMVSFIPVVSKGNKKSVFNFEPNKQYKLPITLTYNLGKDNDGDGVPDKFETTVNWILSPIKGLEDIEVFVDKRVVNTSIPEEHFFKVGYYLVSSNGNKKFIESNDTKINTRGYQIKITDDISTLPDDEVENWTKVSYDFIYDGKKRNCYVVLVDSDGKTIIDYVNIIAVNDGNSAIHLELTQDYISLPCSIDGNKVHEDYDTTTHPIQSQMLLYNGDELIEDGITYSFNINGVPDNASDINHRNVSFSSDGTFIIKADSITGDTNVECIATYNEIPYRKVLFIDLEKTPYELELSKNTLTRDVNTGRITEENLIAHVKYWMDGKWVYTNKGVLKATTINGKENLTFNINPQNTDEKYPRTLYISNSNLVSNNKDTEVRISYYTDGSSQESSYETIGILNTGKNGETGATGDTPELQSTVRIGFSTSEHYTSDGKIDTNSNYWKKSIGDLGDVGVAKPIYILYKQTWKYKISNTEFVTYYIATTLSGTQGIEGKGRVLFYLGSFQDGTLTGSGVEGHLTDERCDYYIDSTGQAWMRIGVKDKEDGVGVNGKPDGNSNDTNWKKSEKVGFLQSNAIHADMINAGSITVNSEIVSALFADDIIANKLTVKSANIEDVLAGKTIQSNINISENNPVPTWQINNTGAGWLANKNIEWDADGVITIQGKGTSIGNAWEITDDGIKSTAGNVLFKKDGSGHIGGYYTSKSKSDIKIQKGISWNENGDVTFYDKVISKPEFIKLSDNNSVTSNSYSVNTTDKATYIFIDDDCKKTNADIIANIDIKNINSAANCTCYKAYLAWFNFSNTINLEDNTICNFTILNHSSKTITFYISTDEDKPLRLPFKLIQDEPIPLHNYRLFNNHNVNYNSNDKTGDGSEYGIQQLFLLPGSKLELCFEKYNSNNTIVQNFYINNISDFRICYNNETIDGLFTRSASLISTNYDLNNFNNYGGYIHPYTYKKSHKHLTLLRLMFSNFLHQPGMNGELKINSSCFRFNDEPDSQLFRIDNNANTLTIKFNEVYNNCIETLFKPSSIYGYDYVNKNGETFVNTSITIKITENSSKYSTVQLIAYSPIYDTIYRSNEANIVVNKEIKLSFSENDWETLECLGYNQQNSILDLFITFVFK